MKATRISDIPTQPLHWLWHNRIPRGKLSLLAGDPATGKTTLALHLAAQLSQGILPSDNPTPQSPPLATARANVPPQSNGTPEPPLTASPIPLITNITNTTNTLTPLATLLLSPEDNTADTLRPKLEAMHANLHHIHILSELHTLIPSPSRLTPQDSRLSLTPLQHLESVIQSIPNLALVIIDPITHYLGLTDRQLPTNPDPSLPRTILASLSRLAEKYNLAILLTTRLTKRIDRTENLSQCSLQRTLGSLAFAAAARTVNLLLPYPTTTPTTPQSPPLATARATVPQHPTETPEPPLTAPSSPLITNITNTTNTLTPPSPNRLLLTIKSNSSSLPNHLPLHLSKTLTLLPDAYNPDDLAPKPKPPGPAALVLTSVIHWLTTLLTPGPLSAFKVIAQAKANAISLSTLNRAKAILSVESVKQDWSARWHWRLPNDTRPLPEDKFEKDLWQRLSTLLGGLNPLTDPIPPNFFDPDPDEDNEVDNDSLKNTPDLENLRENKPENKKVPRTPRTQKHPANRPQPRPKHPNPRTIE